MKYSIVTITGPSRGSMGCAGMGSWKGCVGVRSSIPSSVRWRVSSVATTRLAAVTPRLTGTLVRSASLPQTIAPIAAPPMIAIW